MALKHRFVSFCLNFGISVSKATDPERVRQLAAKLHPVVTKFPLIRAGSEGDGGYLVPDDLEGLVACFSPGVDNRASFETFMIDRKIPCFLADASVKKAPIDGDNVHFIPKYIGVINDEMTMTLDDWIANQKPGDGDIILQMDIEGAEWPVLLSASTAILRRCRIIVLELHDVDLLMDKRAFLLASSALNRLLEEFNVVHNHPNNYCGLVKNGTLELPRVMEITLLRKDRASTLGYAKDFPHLLDRVNDKNNSDVVLPKTWYRS